MKGLTSIALAVLIAGTLVLVPAVSVSAQSEYTLSMNIVGSGAVSWNGSSPYPEGTAVTLTASPAAGWEFDGWSGDLISSNSQETIIMDSDKAITATFLQNGTITAHKFNDRNGNGVQDAGEEDLDGWLMTLYAGSGCGGFEIASGMTDSSGNVVFSNLQPGDYSVEELPLLGWQNTTPICQDVTLPPGGSEIVSFGNQEAICVAVDIKPVSCPNPLNVGSKGVLPVAILGSGDFDVNEVDPDTVLLEGVSPLRWDWEDVAGPECSGPDGYLDLAFKFKTQEIVAALGEVYDGDVLTLMLTGNLKAEFGGIPIMGSDVVWIIEQR